MAKPYVTLLGKSVRSLVRLRGGSGSALPGLFVEKIDPGFIKRILSQLPHGVVIVSGTNGKTTTTKMVVELLEGQGLKVFTNRSGSNFTRGVAAALLKEVNLAGRLPADIAVLELDEAYAVHFVKIIPPRYSLLLNVMRDQLDRFGEIDFTAQLLTTIASSTTEGVTLNREDSRVRAIGQNLSKQIVSYFGLSDQLLASFPDDDTLHSQAQRASRKPKADVTLSAINDRNMATFNIDGQVIKTTLRLRGIYNVFNAAAALALVRQVLKQTVNNNKLVKSLAQIQPAFGRGEKIIVKGQPLELVLVKNPSGFQLSLKSFNPINHATMIAINDNYADGRDMSWLWDVMFGSLANHNVAVVSGIRAYDMALRLQYDQVPVKIIEPNLKKALKKLITTQPNKPKRIYCTYTAMLTLRRELSKITKLKAIDT
jgi:UDP-N-acetylmuramyl tripeptide synthase